MLLWYYSIYYYYYFGGCYIIIIAKLWTGYRFGGTELLSLALKITSCLLIRQICLIWFDALDRESQCVQRDETCFSFLSYSPRTHSPRPILYPIPPGVPLHCCFIGGWLLSPDGSRHLPRRHNYKVRLGSVQFFFTHPKNIGPDGIASLLLPILNCFVTSPSFTAHDNNNILYVSYLCRVYSR